MMGTIMGWTSMVSWGDRTMAPPPLRQFASTSALPSRYVTEDTPADLLEGSMDLTVILPAGHNVNMQVHRSTPMMDLLIQVTTAHKINPGGHVIHVVSDNRLLSYKPSTPIGTLDTSVIQIVPKNKVNDARKNRTHLNTTAIEKNVRLKVNLPRNQLAVYRVPPKTQISDVLELVCKEKSLDINNYEIRHPVNIDEKLRGVCSLSDYQLQEVTVVPRDYRAPPLSVTDLITMAAISHPEDKKRKGIFSIFSRKTKTSSTGDSSLSSGSAGERSVSPARSDESVDGRPPSNTNRPLSHASSTTTLVNAPLPPTRPRKRQAPAPPPGVSNSLVNGTSDHTNHRVEVEKHNGSALSRNSSNSSDQRSSLLSGVDSELSNFDGSRPTTNLTSVVSTSSLSLVSRGKRRAPVPPKPPPPQDENSRPSAIPEETDSVHSLPSQDPKIIEESRVKPNGEIASSPISQTEHLTSSPSSPSSSSFVSSVSSLSSVEQQASSDSNRTTSSSSNPPVATQQPADSNIVVPPPPPETDAPPPPVTECSTNSEAEKVIAVTWSPFTSSNGIIAQTQIQTSITHQNTPTDHPQIHTNHAPFHASSSAADNTGELHNHKTDINSNHISRNDTHHIYSDRLAATTDLNTTHQQQNSYHHYPSSEDNNQTKTANHDKTSRKRSAQDTTNPDSSARQNKEGSDNNSNVVVKSAKSSILNQSPDDAIIPQSVKNEILPEIPTFRLVTKSQTAVKGEEDTKKKFIADGKQQMVGDDYSGTYGKSSINSTKNPLSRGNTLSRQSKINDDDDDMDIDEDMFEPKDIFGTSIQSVDLSQLGSPVNSSTPETSFNSTQGTKIENNLLLKKTAKAQAPQPAPRIAIKSSTSPAVKHKTSSSSSSSSSSESDDESAHKKILNDNIKNDIVISSSVKNEKIQLVKPTPPPRKQNIELNKSHPNVPRPQMKKLGSADSNSSEESKDGKDHSAKVVNSKAAILKASSVDSDESTNIIYHGNLDLSNSRTGGSEISLNQTLGEPTAEDFKVHVSKLSSVDVDMLSLLSEEGVDGGTSSNSSSSTTPVASKSNTLSKGTTASKEIKNDLKDSFEPKVQKSPEPPKVGLSIGGTTGNLRAGFLAMMEELKDWDSSGSVKVNDSSVKENISMELSSRKSSTSESEDGSIKSTSKKSVINSDTVSTNPQEGFIYGNSTNPLNDFSNIKNWKNSESLNTLGIETSSSESSRSSIAGSAENLNNSKELPPGGLRVVDASTLPPGGDASGSLCSNSDNEVQSRTASFSSESSEESQGSKLTVNDTVNNAPVTSRETDTPDTHSNIPEATKPVIVNQIPKPKLIVNEQDIQTNKSIRERSYSSVSTSSGSSYESTTRKESIDEEVHSNNISNGVDSVNKVNLITSINEISNSVKKASKSKHEDDDCDSGTVSDSSQDQDIINKQFIKPKLEEKTVKEELKTEILEVPLPAVRLPESDSKIESSGVLADHKLMLDKQPSASSGSRKDSVSSMSSVSSYESSHKNEKLKLTARRSQELSMRDIESQLQEAFANLDNETRDENVNIQDTASKTEVPHTISNDSNDSINWEYQIPAPPTGFKDGAADDTSSISSDSSQGHIKIPSDCTDSLPSSFTEAKNPALVAETNKLIELPTPGESTDFNSLDIKESKDITDQNNVINDGSKQSVINELKHTLKETNNNEPRIVDVKPKVVVSTMAAPTKKVHNPTESQPPRKDSVNSVSSYESCGESSDIQKVIAREHRSASESSYDSAPPPIPEATYPEDIEVRASRSSSISSTNSAASSNKTKSRGMNFSISTYETRAEEISYDKKIVKSESFNHQVRPAKSNLSKAESFTAQYKTDFSSNDLIEKKEDVKEAPLQNSQINKSESFSHQVRPGKFNLSKTESFTNQSKTDFSSNVLTEEKEDVKEVPLQSSQTNRFITSESQVRSSSLGRVSSFTEKLNSSKNVNDNFIKPELPRRPNRFQRGETSEPLERTASMVDLTHHPTNLRRAQSDVDVTGSGIRDPSMVPLMPDSRLAEEFVKLQQDFFRWQQQLLQNQHLLHSRVAPLASNPPSLQSVGVLRDIMSQSTSNLSENRTSNVSENRTSNLSENRGNERLKSERVIDVKVERETVENNSDEYQNRGVRSLNRPWLSQSVQDVSGNSEETNIIASNRKTYTNQPTRRWAEEPTVTVGAWGERPSQTVGVQQDKDHYTSSPRSRSTQDLSTAHIPEGRRWTPPKTFIAPQPFSRLQAENVGSENKPYHRNQQPKIQPQSNNTDQSASEMFWKELQSRRAAFGLQESEASEEPTRPPRRTQGHIVNGDTTDTHENDISSKTLTYFGQSNGPSEPQSYYYNGEKTAPSALSKVSNNAAISRPRDVESDPSSARYTSVVTLSADKSSQNQGAMAPKDKVRSVVQLSNSDNRPQLRQNPVVRGFRAPAEEKQETFQSRIISNSINTQPTSQPQQVKHKSPPPLLQGYSASQLTSNPSQYSHPSTTTTYYGPASSRLLSAATSQTLKDSMTPSGAKTSSPALSSQVNPTATSAGATFPSVKLRPVTNTSPRASPPVEVVSSNVTPTTSPPPPAPPPAPVAPPPPPSAASASSTGERRTASGKIIKSAKKGPTLDPREELMLAIRNAAGGQTLRKTWGN